MWTYRNPVRLQFGSGSIDTLAERIGHRRYALVTYPNGIFDDVIETTAAKAGAPLIVIDDIAPNPDCRALAAQCARLGALDDAPEVFVALGGGSVIDSTKVFAAAGGRFDRVLRYLRDKSGAAALSATPILAVPTTAGTGSEVTCWATVWDEENGRKYSLARPNLYPECAIVDPALMLAKPRALTVATGLDALSHALESIWNVNANPVSAHLAVAGAKLILDTLPKLARNLDSLDLRSRQAEASLNAGLAFSNTKTAIAHNLSYPITLGWGVQHGIACSFTLPIVLRSVAGIGGFREAALKEIFGADLGIGAARLAEVLLDLGVGLRFQDHGVPADKVAAIVDEAFAGERGRNFVGSKEKFLDAARAQNVIEASAV